MAGNEKTCFIIMPLTTPETHLEIYRDGAEHFQHVLDCLFMPGVESAGYKPIPPIAKGSDVIHVEIIRNLEHSDLVLCDMSCLNPNVFFEYGIRTALNKPVCIVKDEHTFKIPFDTGYVNYQSYKGSLEPWELKQEIEKLAEHLRQSEERSNGENKLWKYFGLRSEVKPYEGGTGVESKLDYLAMQLDAFGEKIMSSETQLNKRSSMYIRDFKEDLIKILPENTDPLSFGNIGLGTHHYKLLYRGTLTEEEKLQLLRIAIEIYGIQLEIVKVYPPSFHTAMSRP